MFFSLISGSSGNASVLKYKDTCLLTDCGMSGKRLETAMTDAGLSCADISGILLTHEHIDHTRGAGVISRRYNIPIYATAGTFMSAELGKISDKNKVVIKRGTHFEIGDIGVLPFEISHDADEPVGYNFFAGDKKYTIATDIGELTNEITEHILGSYKIILEANHDVELLKCGTYPMELKRRILGRRGHLSNTDASRAAIMLLESGTKGIMLGHLSDENNTPDIAYQTVKNALCECGATIGTDISLCVADRYKITRF